MIKAIALLVLNFFIIQTAFASSPMLMMYQDSDQTILSWSVDNEAKLLRQEVLRKDNYYSEPVLVATLSPDERTFEDTSASPYSNHFYQIKAVLDNDQEVLSNVSSPDGSADALVHTSMITTAASECRAGATIQNKTVDCGGITIGLSCDSDSEKQKPVLTLINATVKNVRISKNGGSDGIHCESGNCTLENVIWEDVCEDAATNNGKRMTIIGGVAYNSLNGLGGKPDKVFQHNSKNSTTEIKGNFTLTGEHGKLYRSCGDCTNNGGPRYLSINGVKINAKIGSIAGVNGNYRDVATIRNLKIKDYKYSSGKGKPSVCVEYKGIEKGQGSSSKIQERWNSDECNVSPSDVSKL